MGKTWPATLEARLRVSLGMCSVPGCPCERSEENKWFCDKHRLNVIEKRRRQRAMKKRLLLAGMVGVLCLIFAASAATALNTQWRGRTVDIAKSSIQTESKAITAGAGLFYGIIVRTDGTNDVTLNVYDGKSAAGTKLVPTNIVIDGASYVQGWSFSTTPAITYTGGIYVDVSVAGGGACSYQVFYYTLP